jgi:hypothetical protein
MATKIYIIDCTSRQHPINISEQGASLTVGDKTITFYEHNIPVQVFENAILQKLPFTLSNHEQTVIYNSTNLIGVQIIKV